MKVHLVSLGVVLGSVASAQNLIAVGSGSGSVGQVELYSNYNTSTGNSTLNLSFQPYGSTYTSGVRVAIGDTNGDGVAEIITSTMSGPSNVKVFDLTGNLKQSFFAYDPNFNGGVYVAAGDVNGDGKAEILTGAGPGAGPHVKSFSGTNGVELNSFFAYSASFSGGVRLAQGDINGDGFSDFITGAGPGGGPHVKAFSGNDGSLLQSFFAFDPGLAAGITVASGDVNGDGRADIVVAAGAGGGPHIKSFSGIDGSLLSSFFAFDPGFNEGLNVASGDLDGDGIAEILAGSDTSATGYRIFSSNGTLLNTFADGRGSNIALYSTVPEPSAFLAISAGLIALMARRRRKA